MLWPKMNLFLLIPRYQLFFEESVEFEKEAKTSTKNEKKKMSTQGKKCLHEEIFAVEIFTNHRP